MTQTPPALSRLRADLMLLAAAIIWGLGFVAQSTAMDDVGPLTFTGLRFLLAAAAVFPLALFIEDRRSAAPAMSAADTRASLLTGIVFFLAAALQQWGLVTTTATNAGFFTGLYVVIVPFIALIAFRSLPHAVVWPAALISLVGTWLLGGGGGFSPPGTGDLLVIAGAFFWALHVILIGLVAQRSGRPLRLAAIQFAVCGALGLAAGLALETISLAALSAVLPEVLYAGLISGALGFTLQAIGQRHTPPADAAIILSGEGLFAAIFGAWLLGERLGPAGLAGAALILLAILAVEIVPLLASRKPMPRKPAA